MSAIIATNARNVVTAVLTQTLIGHLLETSKRIL